MTDPEANEEGNKPLTNRFYLTYIFNNTLYKVRVIVKSNNYINNEDIKKFGELAITQVGFSKTGQEVNLKDYSLITFIEGLNLSNYISIDVKCLKREEFKGCELIEMQLAE